MASTFAYTRARDGWRSFGGPDAQRHFERALGLDSELAWATLADEVADGVVRGGDTGINAHLIELLVAGGHTSDAVAAWEAACEVVLHRAPPVGEADVIDVVYDIDPPDGIGPLACAVAARLNLALVDERRVTLGAVAQLVSLGDESFGHALRLAAVAAPASVLTPLLDAMIAYEPPPFAASKMACDALNEVAVGELASARVLSRRLLERVGKSIPNTVPPPLPPVPALSGDRVDSIVRYFGRARVSPIDDIWPAFSTKAAEQYDPVQQSPELKARMQTAFRWIRHKRGHWTRLWFPDDEERERILQAVGARARVALAASGAIAPEVEDEVADLLLGQARLTERYAFSRETRPPWHLLPADAPAFAVDRGVRTVPSGEFAGWVILGHHERQLVVGDGYDMPVTARPEAWSSVAFTDPDVDLNGDLPVGRGLPAVWTEAASDDALPEPILGFLTQYDIVRGPWDVLELLTPHPSVILSSGLRPGRLADGLALVDHDGTLALICRCWRQALLADSDIGDHEYIFEGVELLASEAVLAKAELLGIGELLTISTATDCGT